MGIINALHAYVKKCHAKYIGRNSSRQLHDVGEVNYVLS